MNIGTGWDIHRLGPARPLVIGGVLIPHELGEIGHSDGDALIHALIDALLGAAAHGDIGTHFPSTEQRWKDISSLELLERTLELIKDYTIEHIDCTVILEQPKLQGYVSAIRISISEACSIPFEHVSVKAKTADGLLGELGQGLAIMAQVVVLLKHRQEPEEQSPDRWL